MCAHSTCEPTNWNEELAEYGEKRSSARRLSRCLCYRVHRIELTVELIGTSTETQPTCHPSVAHMSRRVTHARRRRARRTELPQTYRHTPTLHNTKFPNQVPMIQSHCSVHCRGPACGTSFSIDYSQSVPQRSHAKQGTRLPSTTLLHGLLSSHT